MNAEDRSHVLYRLFDSSDVLLYVGITLNIANRFSAHRADKPWWSDVVTIKLEHFADRTAVLRAERAAIMQESPAYNIQMRRAAPVTDYLSTDPVDEARFQVLSMISYTQEDVLNSLQRCPAGDQRGQIAREATERLRAFIDLLQSTCGAQAE